MAPGAPSGNRRDGAVQRLAVRSAGMEEDVPSESSEFGGWWEELRLALVFLTRLPLAAPLPLPRGALARAGWAFPLVGVGVGLFGGILYSLASAALAPGLVPALAAVAATVLLTGALHEDGLADTADGLGGGASRERKLAIMRDHQIGTYGVLALLFSVGLRTAALAAIGDGGRVAAALMAAHALARGGLPTTLYALDPAREDGLGATAGRPELGIVIVAGGIGVLVTLLGFGAVAGLGAVIAASLAMGLVALLARRQIGGYTGDVLGAIEQTGEIAILLAGAAWSS
jgi:adenosylcobinamide-GDP ribazoletransferase